MNQPPNHAPKPASQHTFTEIAKQSPFHDPSLRLLTLDVVVCGPGPRRRRRLLQIRCIARHAAEALAVDIEQNGDWPKGDCQEAEEGAGPLDA